MVGESPEFGRIQGLCDIHYFVKVLLDGTQFTSEFRDLAVLPAEISSPLLHFSCKQIDLALNLGSFGLKFGLQLLRLGLFGVKCGLQLIHSGHVGGKC